jgi:hypothetical protein
MEELGEQQVRLLTSTCGLPMQLRQDAREGRLPSRRRSLSWLPMAHDIASTVIADPEC